jgi:hypothetical protein
VACSYEYKDLTVACSYKYKDLTVACSYKYKDLTVACSYDFNRSENKKASVIGELLLIFKTNEMQTFFFATHFCTTL